MPLTFSGLSIPMGSRNWGTAIVRTPVTMPSIPHWRSAHIEDCPRAGITETREEAVDDLEVICNTLRASRPRYAARTGADVS